MIIKLYHFLNYITFYCSKSDESNETDLVRGNEEEEFIELEDSSSLYLNLICIYLQNDGIQNNNRRNKYTKNIPNSILVLTI